MSFSIERWSDRRLAVTMAVIFGASRVLARVSGVQFDITALHASWQHLDPVLLQNRLGESLWHLHGQPPFFNFLLGIVLKLAGDGSELAFQALFLTMGAALYALSFATLRRFAVSRTCAFVSSTLFVISPSYILYESWLFYTLPLALLVTSATFCLARLIERASFGRCAAFFVCVALLCATHGIFHLAYLLLCIGFVLWTRLAPRAVVLASAAVPLLFVAGLYTKNAVLFDQFGTSTWMGMNIALRRLEAVPAPEKDRLIAAGSLSDVARVTPFDPLDHYPSHYAAVPARFSEVPSLANARKSDGAPNLNHFGYIAISKRYGDDTKFVVTHYPKILVLSLMRGWYEYFRSSSDYWFLEPNLERSAPMRGFNRAWDLIVYGVVLKRSVGLFLLLLITSTVVASLRAAARGTIRVRALTREERLLLGFCAATVLFVAVVANTLNALENMRIRFMTDPLVVFMAAFWAQNWAVSALSARLGRKAV